MEALELTVTDCIQVCIILFVLDAVHALCRDTHVIYS